MRWPEQTFVLSDEIVEAFSYEDVQKTIEGLEAFGLDRAPFKDYIINLPMHKVLEVQGLKHSPIENRVGARLNYVIHDDQGADSAFNAEVLLNWPTGAGFRQCLGRGKDRTQRLQRNRRKSMKEIAVTLSVPLSRITDMIIGAIEGDSNYWLERFTSVSHVKGTRPGPWYTDEATWENPFVVEARYGSYENDEDEPTVLTLTEANLVTGLLLMAKNSPRHFADMLSENDDAVTADIFMQYFVLGEIIYG